jgi:hypothetical protein
VLIPAEETVRLDKKFIATLLDISESEITSISGLTLELADVPDRLTTFKDLVSERYTKKLKLLSDALRSEDDLGKMVRAHIHIEHELQDIIFFAAPNPTQLKAFENIEYSEKVRLALILGLNSELKPPLNAIGTLRNKFSHRLDMKIGEDEAKNLIATLPPLAKQRFKASRQEALSAIEGESELNGEARSFN